MLQITRGTDYGVRVVAHLSTLPAGGRAKLEELAAATDVPASFLSKILQELSGAGLIVSHRGATGGFELALSPARITMLDVVTALEGPVALNCCLGEPGSCLRKPICPIHPVWFEAQSRFLEVLRAYTFDRVVPPGRTAPGSEGVAS